ncbi:hypothetical protein JD969_04390 [Planctomycetota bacterium]|nr:hypothetical protein JD969_04390 [Planctomycetota bacterium]
MKQNEFWEMNVMFKMMIKMMSVMLVVCMCGMSWGEVVGDTKLLLEVDEMREENAAKIMTWQGTAVVMSQNMQGGELRDHHGAYVYAVDEAEGFKRWKRVEGLTNFLPIEALVDMAEPGVDEMVAPDGFYNVKRHMRRVGENVDIKTLVIFELEKGKRRIMPYVDSFDPMMYMDGLMHSDLHKMLVFRHENAEKMGEQGLMQVTREGDVVSYVLTSDHKTINLYQFDLSQGGNLVLMRSVYSSQIWQTKMSWQEVDGIWLPKTFDYVSHNTVEKSTPQYHSWHVEFGEQRVNEKIDPKVFTIEAMGVQPTTSITDWRDGEGERIDFGEGSKSVQRAFYRGEEEDE